MLNIDWVKCRVFLRHKTIKGNTVMELTDTGEVIKHFNKSFLQFRGSFESSITLKTYDIFEADGQSKVLEIDGNPAKFLNGHNLFGYDNLNLLMFCFLHKLTVMYPEVFPYNNQKDLLLVLGGFYIINRIDLNKMYKVSNDSECVNSVLRDISNSANMKYRGRSTMTYNSLYFGKGSRRNSILMYNKEEELKKNFKIKKPNESDNSQVKNSLELEKLKEELIECSKGFLRVEVKILLTELLDKQLAIRFPRNLTINKLEDVYSNYVKGIKMSINDKALLTDEQLELLKPNLRGTYKHWLNGEDLLLCLSKASFFRHKKELLKYGIDISVPHIIKKKEDKTILDNSDNSNLFEKLKDHECLQPPKDISNRIENITKYADMLLEREFGIKIEKVEEQIKEFVMNEFNHKTGSDIIGYLNSLSNQKTKAYQNLQSNH